MAQRQTHGGGSTLNTKLLFIIQFLKQTNERIEDWLADVDRQRARNRRYMRPTHDLLCNCRKCVPSIKTYWHNVRGL
jgi:hypothetical protein